MEISWLGYACFRLRGREAAIVMDPYEKSVGLNLGKLNAHIVTVSHHHPAHDYVAAVVGTPKIVDGPGEYEIAEVSIKGISTFHDNKGGAEWGKNTVYLIEVDDLIVCHLGDLGHVPTSEQTEQLSNVDVLLVPVGGGNTIGAADAAETVSLIEPKVIIPMHYRAEGSSLPLDSVDKFLKEMGLKELPRQPKLNISKSNLPQEPQVILLDPSRQ